MRTAAWLLTLVMACSGGDEAPAPNPTPPVAKAPKAKAKAKAEEPEVAAPAAAEEEAVVLTEGERARAAVVVGSAAAVADVEARLVAAPSELDLWRLLEHAGASSPRDLLDRLDANAAIGGMEGPHQLLRAELALAAGLPKQALEAALAAAGADPDGSAAMVARAVRAGAPAPSSGGSASQADLVAFVSADRASEAAGHEAGARAVPGWRAALARAQAEVAREEWQSALTDFGIAAGEADPRAQVQGNLGRARLVAAGHLKGAGSPELHEAQQWAALAVKAAGADGDGLRLFAGLDLLGQLAEQTGDVDLNLDVLTEVGRMVPADAEGPRAGDLQRARIATAIAAGRLEVARSAAASLSKALPQPSGSDGTALSWGFACYGLGDAEGLQAARSASSGAHERALGGLAAFLAGDGPGGAGRLALEGLPDALGARVAMEVALHSTDQSEVHAAAAVAAADRAGGLALRVETRLLQEQLLRRGGSPKAAQVRAELASLATTPGLKAELAVRTLLEGGTATIPAVDGSPSGVWSLAAGGTDPGNSDPWSQALRPFLKAWTAGDGASASAAMASVPLHRQGLTRTGTALDGSQGMPVEQAMAAMGETSDEAQLGLALSAHELSHRLDAFAADDRLGVDPTAGLDAVRREALLSAAARLRSQLMAHEAQGRPWPTEAVDTYDRAEAGGADLAAFARRLPKAGPDLAGVRGMLGRASVLSYRFSRGKVEGLVVAPAGARLRILGSVPTVLAAADSHLSALKASADRPGRASHTAGDRLRKLLVDPFSDVLAGHGTYVVVAPDPLLGFMFTSFPEQANGLRWLADIRTVSVASRFLDLTPPEHDIPSFKPDFLALGEPAAGGSAGGGGAPPEEAVEAGEGDAEGDAEGADEAAGAPAAAEEAGGYVSPKVRQMSRAMSSGARHFGQDFREVLVGSKAERWRYVERAPRARYLYIEEVPASADGGFALADAPLTLRDIRETPLAAELVVISADAPTAQQLARARAFLDAGAAAVVVTSWEVPESERYRQIDAFYEAVNRDRSPARALLDARQGLLSEVGATEDTDDPALWGASVLFGSP